MAGNDNRNTTGPLGRRKILQTGGLALGAWALRRGGMGTEHIARRTVAFFFLTSLANVAMLIGFALLYATGVLHHDRNPPLTYAFGVAGLLAGAIGGCPARCRTSTAVRGAMFRRR